jgi:quercetin 2,3-dioxygenase
MMMQLRKSAERGFANHGWLKSRHTFSFADYYDPQHMGFRALRVINDDRIDGGSGFGAHPHRDMEIISYVMEGGLRHQDSAGNKTIIEPGEVQRMSAGSGVTHSEYNAFEDRETHFLQIWILPAERGGSFGYGQKSFAEELQVKSLVLVVSGDGRDSSIAIRQDVDLYLSRLGAGESLEFRPRAGRGIWIQVLQGQMDINGQLAQTGDGLAMTDESLLRISASESAEFMLFDLA